MYIFIPQLANIRARNTHICKWVDVQSAAELSLLATNPEVENSSFAQQILLESAARVGVQVAAVANYLSSDLTVNAQGSLFWNGYNYKECVAAVTANLTTHDIIFEYIEDCDIKGAACLVP